MLCVKKKSGKTAGFTLIELIVTLALLIIIIAPIMRMLVEGSQTTMLSNEMMAASLTAQLRIEELVGWTRDELCEEFEGITAHNDECPKEIKSESDYNGFYVEAVIKFYDENEADPDPPYPELANATVIVKKNKADADSDALCIQENTLNVAMYQGGGG